MKKLLLAVLLLSGCPESAEQRCARECHEADDWYRANRAGFTKEQGDYALAMCIDACGRLY